MWLRPLRRVFTSRTVVATMNRIISISISIALLGGSGCVSDAEEGASPAPAPAAEAPTYDGDYFDGEGFVLPESHVNVVRRISVTTESSPGVAMGFDLDARVSEPGDAETCNHGDLLDPSGVMGVDNQLARMWPALEPLVGTAVEGLIQGAIDEGRMLMMLELSGVDDLQNDEDVTFSLFSGLLDPDVGVEGLIPDQTFYYDYGRPSSSVEGVQIVAGELLAGPVRLQIPLNILDARFNLDILDGWVRITIDEDGSFDGILGGAFNVDDVLGQLLDTGAAAETRLVSPIFEANADMGLEDGRCTLFSTAFEFEGTTAFVVREPDHQ